MPQQGLKQKRKHKLKDKRLFLNYAMPCMVERVRRGEFTQEEFEKALDLAIGGCMKVYELQKEALRAKYGGA